jgi:predicted AlkP superfamily pyrophosphatase or phosphodiesterase
MMKALLAALLASIALPAAAQEAVLESAQPPASANAVTPRTPPKLIVAISVDQFSANLFAQYRNRFTDGFARLLQGAVFPAGYQSHAATETCPGHSTILTGMRPGRTGIIANNWINQDAPREDKEVYCSEDERIPGTDHRNYKVADLHLKVPTLGEMMKAANPASRVVSVAGKDRAAIMMGGHKVDELWFWDGKDFVSYDQRPVPPAVQRGREAVARLIAQPQEPLPVPAFCRPLMQPITVGGQTIGDGRFARAAGDLRAFRGSPALDGAVFAIAAGLIQDMKLGQGDAPDIISIGASATDYVGHGYGPGGGEMCLQMAELDKTLGGFFAALDSWGIDYQVVLTADHGGHDATERQQQRGMPGETRVTPALSVRDIGAEIGKQLRIAGPVLLGSEGDVYVSNTVPANRRKAVLAEAVKRISAFPQVATVLTREQIAAATIPDLPPEAWTLEQRAHASYDPERSGDLLIMLKPRVSGIAKPGPGYVATHGSPWDYDRRVPILFWRKGMAGFEQPQSIETVDIVPTLAATINLPVKGLDGRCLDLDSGAGDTCR